MPPDEHEMTDQPLPPDQPVTSEAQETKAASGHTSVPTVAVPAPAHGPFKQGFGLGAGAGAGLAVALLVAATVLSLIGSLGLLAAGAFAQAGRESTLVTAWGPTSATHTLHAVDINGTILTDQSSGGLLSTGTYGYEIAEVLDGLDADDADGVVLRINTPGGTITGAKAIADAVARYQGRTGKKVFAHVQGLSASGGMYAMAGADDIQADYGSSIGSIGVIFGPFVRYHDVVAIDNGALGGGVTTTGGIDQFYISQGKGKDAGTPYRDLTAEERAVFQQGVDNEYAAFVAYVAEHRGIPEATIREDLGAYLFDNQTAEEKKLIDGTMGVDEAYRHFATLAGLDPADTRVVAGSSPGFLSSVLGVEQRVPGQALPVAVEAGVRPVTASVICGPEPRVLAYHGDPSSQCG